MSCSCSWEACQKEASIFKRGPFWMSSSVFEAEELFSERAFNFETTSLQVSIGYSPDWKLSTTVRITDIAEKTPLDFNLTTYRRLILSLHDIFSVNIESARIVIDIDDDSYNYQKGPKDLSRRKQVAISRKFIKKYEISDGKKVVQLSEKFVKSLIENDAFIMQMIAMYQKEEDAFKLTFFTFLHFCEGEKKLKKDNFKMSECYEKLLNAACNCYSKMFITDVAVKFYYCADAWIRRYENVYWETEENRLKSFENFPFAGINSEVLAKNGFRYMANSVHDKIMCVYCGMVVSKWNIDPDLQTRHEQMFPFCPIVNPIVETNELEANTSDDNDNDE